MANLKGSENPFPSILIQEAATDGSDTDTPVADFRNLFLGEDGSLHLKDSAAAVTTVGGAGGAVATDAIWDAAGDLAVGSGANTAAKLSVGSNGNVLTVTAGAVGWAAPAAPASSGARYPVQTASQASASGTTRVVTFGATPTNGNKLYMLTLAEGTTSVSGISQTNVTWTNLAIASAGVSPVIELWKGVVSASAGTAATVTWSGTEFHCAVGLEFSGTSGTLSASQTRHVTTDPTGTHPMPLITPSNITDLILTGVSSASNGTTFSAFAGMAMVIVETGRTLAVAWGFPGTYPAYGNFTGGASATASGLSASIA